MNDGEEGYNLFPSLTHLTVVCVSTANLTTIRAPNLHTLHLNIGGSRVHTMAEVQIFQRHCVQPGHLNPVLLRLTDTSLFLETLVDLLNTTNRLEALVLTKVPLKKPFWESLEPRERNVVEKSAHTGRDRLKKVMKTPFEGLKEIKVDLADCWASTKAKNTRALAPKVMKKRAKINGMRKATVRFTHEEGWVDLLQ
jgi:hypothetical protein